jgi:hypothetical protein
MTTRNRLRAALAVALTLGLVAGAAGAQAKGPKMKKFDVVGKVVRIAPGQLDVCVGTGTRATRKDSVIWAGKLVSFTTGPLLPRKRGETISLGSWVKLHTHTLQGTRADEGPFAVHGDVKLAKLPKAGKRGKKKGGYGQASCPTAGPTPVDTGPDGPSGDNG